MWLLPGLEQETYNMSLEQLITLERKEAMRKVAGEYIHHQTNFFYFKKNYWGHSEMEEFEHKK